MGLTPRYKGMLFCLATFVQTASFAQAPNKGLLEKPLQELLKNVHSQTTGNVSASQLLSLNLSLPLRNEGQLDKFLQQIADPASPNFRHYLTPDQFVAQYAPSQSDYTLLVQWAKNNGLTVVETPSNRNYVAVQASAATVNSVFHVSLKNFIDLNTGRRFFGPDQEPTPATPVPLLAITGLDTIVPKQHHVSQGTPVANAGGSGTGGSFTPTDIRAAYYPQNTLDGSDVAVAIFSFNGYQTSDLNLYYQTLGITQPTPVSNVLVNGYNGACTSVGGGVGYTGCYDAEQIIDIAAVAGISPSVSNLYFYEGTSSTNILNQMVSDNLASVISSSWSGGDFGSGSESIFKQMQSQGMTYLNASGDTGAYQTTPQSPALSPSIVQVGGTVLTTNGPGGSYNSETGWPESSGGWIANTFSIPSFQQSAITTANGGSTSWRNSPDVSAEGNFDNLGVNNGISSTDYGGTSFAAPRWAGIIALAKQQANENCENTVGFVPPILYSVLNTANYASDFHDVTSGNNGNGGAISYNAVPNYDLVTGLGSPSGQNLINLLVPPNSSPTSTSVSFSYTSGPQTTFSAHITSSSGSIINTGNVSFSYADFSGTTQACSANVVNNNASCSTEVNDQTHQYTITASYGGNTFLHPNGCAASSTSSTAIGTGYGF